RVSAAATRAVALLGVLALWAAVAHGNAWLGVVNPVLLPTPVEVSRVGLALAWSGELTRHFLTSLGRVAQGFGLAALAALGLGLGLALFVIVGAEFMGADAGLGHLIMEGRTFFNPAQIVMGALVLGLLGSLINTLLLVAERRLLRWRAAA